MLKKTKKQSIQISIDFLQELCYSIYIVNEIHKKGGVLSMIQLKLDFELEKSELPIEIDRLTVSFIKASLSNYSEEMFERLYDKSKSIMKSFCYSYYLPGAKFQKDKILLNQKQFTMFFSDSDWAEIIQFFNAYKKMLFCSYPMKNNSMTLKSIRVLECDSIKDCEIIVKMQSSLIVRRHDSSNNKDTYYTYEHPEFGEVLKENISFFLEKMGILLPEEAIENFSIAVIKGKKIVANVFGRSVDANIGIYKLSGSQELLNILYQSGMGCRRSEGHGKFEVIW